MIKELGLVAIGAIALTMTLIGTSDEAEAAAFLKFEGVDGESTDQAHDKWIDVLSFSHSMHIPVGATAGTTRERASAVVEDFTITKELDKSSPKISEKLLMGEVIPKVEIELTANYGGSRATYLKYELTNVMVTSYSISGSGQSGDVPMESISLNFEEIKVTYTENDSSGRSEGNVEYSWNVEKGES